MSSFITEKTENNFRFISFEDYILLESIKPKQGVFGLNSDMNNMDFFNSNNTSYTFMNFGDRQYCIIIDQKNRVGFGVSDDMSLDPSDYTDNRRFGTTEVIKVFNQVIWAILYMAKETKRIIIKFSSADPKLGVVYDRMVKNKYLIDSLIENGYEYKGKNEHDHIFSKIK